MPAVAIPIALAAAGTLLQAKGQRDAGKAAAIQGQYQQDEANRLASEASAASQRKAIDTRRQVGIAQSRLQAVAASEGGGGDPTVVNLAGSLAKEGEYRALTDIYEGKSQSNYLTEQGNLAAFQGKEAKRAGNIAAASTLLNGASSMFAKYGGGGGSGGVPYNTATGSNGNSVSNFSGGQQVRWYG